jgi:hypothetical protein
MATVTLNDVRKFFGYDSLGAFRTDWSSLTDEDKAQIKGGLEDVSLTY